MAASLYCPRLRGGWSPGALGAASNPLKGLPPPSPWRYETALCPRNRAERGASLSCIWLRLRLRDPSLNFKPPWEGVGWNVLVDEGRPTVQTS